MASTKATTELYTITPPITLIADAVDTQSVTATINVGYGGALNIKITNGATGPTVAAQVQIEVSNNGTNFYNFGGPLVAQLGNTVVTSWGGIDIPIGTTHLRLQAGSNTDEDVVVAADISEVTKI